MNDSGLKRGGCQMKLVRDLCLLFEVLVRGTSISDRLEIPRMGM